MKYLVIPDVHQKLDKLERVFKKVQKFDKLVSLGDWFDNFHDTPEDSMRTAMRILDLYEELGDNFVWLLGNHDVPYVFPETYDLLRCSGNTAVKLATIQKVFEDKLDKRKVKLAYRIKHTKKKDIILSHAGVSRYHFATIDGNLSSKRVLTMCDEALDRLCAREDDPMIGGYELMLMAGKARMGSLPVGGITWQDWNLEFRPHPQISQIVGHTPTRNPQVMNGSGSAIAPDEGTLETGLVYNLAPGVSYNFNIDTHLNHYMIIENGKITIHTNYDPID